ncbi:MAG: hypothetical protein VX815_19595 [Gemmatimonadota bacterium]|nr:hypothetical protein [Gemmatimonadota bacterium]
MALWGLLGSAAVQAMLVTGFLGGTFAPGTVGIARRAELKAGEQFGYFRD